jgi:hypothetical protein
VEKPERRRPFRGPKRRLSDNIKKSFEKCDGVGVGGGAWSRSIWLEVKQVAGSSKCGIEPSATIKCGEILD